MWALTGKQTKWSATAGLVMSLPWTEAVLSLSFCLWKEVVSMLHSPLRPWDWRRLTLVENLWLEIRTEEKYLTEKKHLLLKARQSCNFFLFFSVTTLWTSFHLFCEWFVNAECFHSHIEHEVAHDDTSNEAHQGSLSYISFLLSYLKIIRRKQIQIPWNLLNLLLLLMESKKTQHQCRNV